MAQLEDLGIYYKDVFAYSKSKIVQDVPNTRTLQLRGVYKQPPLFKS